MLAKRCLSIITVGVLMMAGLVIEARADKPLDFVEDDPLSAFSADRDEAVQEETEVPLTENFETFTRQLADIGKAPDAFWLENDLDSFVWTLHEKNREIQEMPAGEHLQKGSDLIRKFIDVHQEAFGLIRHLQSGDRREGT